MKILLPAARPCGSCPYPRRAPAGLWAASEYAKLPDYDGPTHTQPTAVFMCHQRDGRLCAGWAGCHDMQESLAARIAVATGELTVEDYRALLEYATPVELWPTGADAARHGLSQLEDPDERTRRLARRLLERGALVDDPPEAPENPA